MQGTSSDASGTVVVELNAAETEWDVGEGIAVVGCAFNGSVPGPTIEGSVGDTLVVRLTNAAGMMAHFDVVRPGTGAPASDHGTIITMDDDGIASVLDEGGRRWRW